MLFSVSIVNVAILLFLLAACCGHHIDHSIQRKRKSMLRDYALEANRQIGGGFSFLRADKMR